MIYTPHDNIGHLRVEHNKVKYYYRENPSFPHSKAIISSAALLHPDIATKDNIYYYNVWCRIVEGSGYWKNKLNNLP